MLKILVVYLMWNPEICQDPPTCGEDDLVLSLKNIRGLVKINWWFDVTDKIIDNK
jgi:hypothetical protein